MLIKRVDTYAIDVPAPHKGGQIWVFVKLTTDNGIEGWGECNAIFSKEKTVVQLVNELAEKAIIGKMNPFNIEKLWMSLYEFDGCHFSRHPAVVENQAIAAIEMACWDIVGKSLNRPIYNLLGGVYHEKLRSYTYMNYRDWSPGKAADIAAREAAQLVKEGFTAIKLDPIIPLCPQPRELTMKDLQYAEDVIRSVREAVGNNADILIGTHGQFTTSMAIRFAKRMEKYDPFWFEEPVPMENVDEMAQVARATTIPVATGERLATKWEYLPLFEKHAARIIQINVGLNGILESKKIAGMAESHFAQISPWMYCGPIAGAANIQLDVCSPNFVMQEGIEHWDGFHAEILKEPIKWEKGYIIPPTKPGLGVEPNEKVMNKHLIKF